ncbi:hypothetical protein KJS94_07220 [Flavihumibacter rivuli]|uniref:hypothetical protein n=1 Tax=Flavihumibacter rivuli TaxID=2838156 RepID=UPI001BDEF552|nr:hypothetical protein [Flavihumibacter rivuli]ULQ57990.1 hypothetical protein KJS94_07220 [Flavihumibacter rivuli]
MIDVLTSYLFQHKSISIPGMGTLHLERTPARTDFVNKQVLAPVFSLRFDKYFDAPDKEFFSYLAGKQKIADFEAIKVYNEFAYDLRGKIRAADEAEWPGLGFFRKDANGEIYFETKSNLIPAFAPVAADRVIRPDSDHQIRVGDEEVSSIEMTDRLAGVTVERESWWIYAAIIAAIALGLIVYQGFRKGFTLHDLANDKALPLYSMPANHR